MKKPILTAMMAAVLISPALLQTVRASSGQSVVEQADMLNWVANTPEQISDNMQKQNIDVNNLNGTKYVVQWGDTLSQISEVTNISVAKLAYDNNIPNIDLIYVGQVLILNANGTVLASFSYQGNGQTVASTQTNLNSNKDEAKIVVSPVINNTQNNTSTSASSQSNSETDESTASSISTTNSSEEKDGSSDSSASSSTKKSNSSESTESKSTSNKKSSGTSSSASSASSSKSKTSSSSSSETMNREEFLQQTVDELNDIAHDDDLDIVATANRDDAPADLAKDTKHRESSSAVIYSTDDNKFTIDEPEYEAKAIKDHIAKLFGESTDKYSDLAKNYHHVYITYNPRSYGQDTVYDVYVW